MLLLLLLSSPLLLLLLTNQQDHFFSHRHWKVPTEASSSLGSRWRLPFGRKVSVITANAACKQTTEKYSTAWADLSAQSQTHFQVMKFTQATHPFFFKSQFEGSTPPHDWSRRQPMAFPPWNHQHWDNTTLSEKHGKVFPHGGQNMSWAHAGREAGRAGESRIFMNSLAHRSYRGLRHQLTLLSFMNSEEHLPPRNRRQQ